MAVLTLEDLHGAVEVVVFPRLFEKQPDFWREDAILVVEGKVDPREDRTQVILDRAEEWIPPAQGAQLTVTEGPGDAETRARGNADTRGNGATEPGFSASPPARVPSCVVRVTIPRNGNDDACLRLLEQLHGVVERNPGQDQLRLILRDRAGGRVELIDAAITIQYSPEVEAQLRDLVGEEQLGVISNGHPTRA